jgi:hypothetical protein
VTVIKTVRKGWTEQYGLMVYEIVASVDGKEFRAVRSVSQSNYLRARTRFEDAAREQITQEANAMFSTTNAQNNQTGTLNEQT